MPMHHRGPPLLLRNPVERFSGLDWSPDGERIAFISGPASISTVTVRTGEAQELFRAPEGYVRYINWSPDGGRISFNHYQAPVGKARLMVAPVDGGEPQAVVTEPPPREMLSHSWAPHGRAITYALYDPARDRNSLWTVSIPDGAARRLETGHENSISPCWSRDGKGLAFAAASQSLPGRKQFWVMENFQTRRE